MDREKIYQWSVAGGAAVALAAAIQWRWEHPPISTFLFWALLLIAVELLPVALAFGSEVTMGFPIHLAIALLFNPWVGMTIAGLAAVDPRELRREIPLARALFNKAQTMLAVGVASWVFALIAPELRGVQIHPGIVLYIFIAAFLYTAVNLTLVAFAVRYNQGVPVLRALGSLPPRPMTGFWVSYAILAGLGAATAVVYDNVRYGAWAVAAFIIPLLFARVSIVGARAQQRMSERLQKQQEALLEVTEQVLGERERERQRIAEDIHDSSLQMLTAAAYGCENADDYLRSGQRDETARAIATTKEAVQQAMRQLRNSLMDLRGSTLKGGLAQTVQEFADEASTLWGADVRVESELDREPPSAVALAAFQILQEGVTNALKHGEGTPVLVRMTEEDGQIYMTVEDRGPGFDPTQEVGEDHVGLRLMRERAARVGGHLELESKPSQGTRLEVSLPGGVTA